MKVYLVSRAPAVVAVAFEEKDFHDCACEDGCPCRPKSFETTPEKLALELGWGDDEERGH